MRNLTVRSALTVDAGAVLTLWAEAVVGASLPDDVAAVMRLLEHEPDSLVVADLDGTIVGSVIATWDGWRGNFYRLAVHPDHRRKGIGRRLVSEGEQRLRARGCLRVTALVTHDHDWATEFWRHSAYEHDERTARFVRNLG